MMAEQAQLVSIASLLAVPENSFWLECVRRAEDGNPASLLNRYRKMTTPAPPIRVDRNNIITDGRHRVLVAIERGRTHIEAIGK